MNVPVDINLNEIKRIWLNDFPIQELPDDYTQLVVRSYRNENCLEITAMQGLNRREKELKEWFKNQMEINKILQYDKESY